MNLTLKSYATICLDVLLVSIAFYFGHWIGFALAVFFIVSVYALQLLAIMETARNVLLSRLPDRCAMCHREIVDEGGTIDEDLEGETKIYHETCADKLDSMRKKQKFV